ncbi:Abi-alpha family protein [Acidithiobacillus ferriphilus]|uniref:Abi-alpha family protein n=1 Tax=Acidithiobacillus ferriphilus TaxID=1689834 RepID=UPI001E376521|nr:Abi-alpha family protein [Acidithiobacillus ferriphilus]UEP58330.1 DUF4393 domain-containing protein [Acidithiobacillus ferriphilus]
MADFTDPSSETAKAVVEVAKTTGKAIDASREAGRFISRFIAGSLEQGVGIFEDRLRYMRWERQLRLMKRSEEVLHELGFEGPTRPVPMKIAIPLLQTASMEEDDSLQDRWINLLVNAANEKSGVEVNRAYIEILSQITPLEAQILDAIYFLPFAEIQHRGVITSDLPDNVYVAPRNQSEWQEPAYEVALALANLARIQTLKPTMVMSGAELYSRVIPTIMGSAFVSACRVRKP